MLSLLLLLPWLKQRKRSRFALLQCEKEMKKELQLETELELELELGSLDTQATRCAGAPSDT